jgi:uncharacterized protein involved in exopolysaccharide biosynthesis
MFDPAASGIGFERSPKKAPGFRPLAVDPRRLAMAFVGRRRIVLISALLAAGIAVATAKLVVTPEYQARCALEWDRPAGADPSGRELRTVVDGAKVSATVSRVRAELGLDATLEEIASRIELHTREQSNVVAVVVRADASEQAVDLASSFVEAFLEHRRQVDGARHEGRAAEIEANLREARAALEETRARWLAFRRKHGIVDLEGETQVAIEQAALLRAQAESAQAEARAHGAKMGVLRSAAQQQGETTVLSEKQVRPEAVKLAERRAELVATGAKLTELHPRVRRLEAEVDALEDHVTGEAPSEVAERTVGRNPQWDVIQQQLTSTLARRAAAAQKEESFRELSHGARARLDELAEVRHEAHVLTADLDRAEQRATQLTDALAAAEDSARNASSGLRLLDAPVADPFPVRSLRRPIAFGITMLGILLSALFVLLRELRGGRIRTASELAFWSGVPVVLASRWPEVSGGRRDVVHAVRSVVPPDGGTVLLVGWDDEERRWARLIARQLRCTRTSQSEIRVRCASPVWDSARVRRAARRATVVLAVVAADRHGAWKLLGLRGLLGRSAGVGSILLGVGAELDSLPDQAGAVAQLRDGVGGDEVPAVR